MSIAAWLAVWGGLVLVLGGVGWFGFACRVFWARRGVFCSLSLFRVVYDDDGDDHGSHPSPI